MKRNMATIMVLMLAVLTLFGCSSSKSTSDDGVHIGILQYVEHQSLTAARKGFVDELEKEGYIDGDNIVIDYENAQGDQSNLQTISTNLIANNDIFLLKYRNLSLENRLPSFCFFSKVLEKA